jgi:hypothetical protein
MNFEDFLLCTFVFVSSPSPLSLTPSLVSAFLYGLKLLPVTGRASLKTSK